MPWIHGSWRSPAAITPRPSRATGPRRFWTAIALAAITLPALTLLLVLLGEHVDLALALVLYLLAVVVIALVGGLVPALLAALAAGLLADYYFTAPVHSLRVERPADVFALVVYVVTAVVGTAAGMAARRTYQAVRASSEARTLSRLATAMMHGQDLPALLEQVGGLRPGRGEPAGEGRRACRRPPLVRRRQYRNGRAGAAVRRRRRKPRGRQPHARRMRPPAER
ncbi:DUF4118 domain-containing protein [Streptomyces sp. NPDC032472]|uniref:DUF4118 domain-containing protein n=1 Tax=Streptomyces sp. NPDC032472 TaxID=3155018 RepID=UPI0033F4801F